MSSLNYSIAYVGRISLLQYKVTISYRCLFGVVLTMANYLGDLLNSQSLQCGDTTSGSQLPITTVVVIQLAGFAKRWVVANVVSALTY